MVDMTRILLLILILLLPVNAFGDVVIGTNAGFVTVAPVDDPNGSGGATTVDDEINATQDTLPANATTITEIGFYISTQGDDQPNFEVGIYDDDGLDFPSDALGRDQTNALPIGNDIWVRVTVSIDVSSHQSTLLWIPVQIDNVTPAVTMDRTGSGVGVGDAQGSQTTLPDPYPGSGPDTTRQYAIYAVYTTDGVTAPRNQGFIIGLLDLGDWKEMMGLL